MKMIKFRSYSDYIDFDFIRLSCHQSRIILYVATKKKTVNAIYRHSYYSLKLVASTTLPI